MLFGNTAGRWYIVLVQERIVILTVVEGSILSEPPLVVQNQVDEKILEASIMARSMSTGLALVYTHLYPEFEPQAILVRLLTRVFCI
jgi:hypothetical protein